MALSLTVHGKLLYFQNGGGSGNAARRAGDSRHGDLRRRLLLVHEASVRPARRRRVHDPGVRGRSRGGSELRGRLSRPDGHLACVQVVYESRTVGYDMLVDVCCHNIDPLEPDGQCCDHGPQYHTAIFYRDAAQWRVVEESKREGRLNQPIVTAIVPQGAFYFAEPYHQHYYRKHPIG